MLKPKEQEALDAYVPRHAAASASEEQRKQAVAYRAAANKAVAAALSRLASLEPDERVETLLDMGATDRSARRAITRVCSEKGGDDFYITCPRFLGQSRQRSPSVDGPPLVLISGNDAKRLRAGLKPLPGKPHLFTGRLHEISCEPHLGPQCRLLNVGGISHAIHCENLNNVDISAIIPREYDFLWDSVSGLVAPTNTTQVENRQFFFLKSMSSDIPGVLISDADMDELLHFGGSTLKSDGTASAVSATGSRLHCDIRVARQWVLPAATRAEAYEASCTITGEPLNDQGRRHLRDTLMKFFQLSASTRGAQRVSSICAAGCIIIPSSSYCCLFFLYFILDICAGVF